MEPGAGGAGLGSIFDQPARDTTRDRGSADKREQGARARLGRGKADAEPVVDFAQVG